MKICCDCGHIIVDSTDNLPFKGRYLSDVNWESFWNAIDKAIESPSDTDKEREERCMNLRKMNLFSTMYECQNCGALYINKGKDTIKYTPETPGTNHLFKAE